jgi:hypothetical protein
VSEPIKVEVGQVWADNDSRSTGRTVRVVAIEGDKAVVETVTYSKHVYVGGGRKQSRIALKRFKPNSTGYRLVEGA